MYYKYVATALTYTDIAADIALLITGGVISACSPTCDKVNSAVLASLTPSGWTQIDTYTDVNGTWPVLAGPDADGITTKYVTISRPTSTGLGITIYETWNTVAHTGTNAVSNANMTWGATNNLLTFYIAALPRTLAIIPSNNGAQVGKWPLIVGEFTRDALYLKQKAYPVSVGVSGPLGYLSVGASICRMKNTRATGDIFNPPAFPCLGPMASDIYNSWARDENENPYYPIYPVWVTHTPNGTSNAAGANNGFILGQLYDVFCTTPNLGSALDEISDGVDTYVLVVGGGTSASLNVDRFAIRKA